MYRKSFRPGLCWQQGASKCPLLDEVCAKNYRNAPSSNQGRFRYVTTAHRYQYVSTSKGHCLKFVCTVVAALCPRSRGSSAWTKQLSFRTIIDTNPLHTLLLDNTKPSRDEVKGRLRFIDWRLQRQLRFPQPFHNHLASAKEVYKAYRKPHQACGYHIAASTRHQSISSRLLTKQGCMNILD